MQLHRWYFPYRVQREKMKSTQILNSPISQDFNICYLLFSAFLQDNKSTKNFTTHVVIMCQRRCFMCGLAGKCRRKVLKSKKCDNLKTNAKSYLSIAEGIETTLIYRFWLIQFCEIWEENYSLKDNERSSTLVSFWLLCLKLRRKIALLAIKLVLFGLL